MTDYRELEQQLTNTLKLERRPVAVKFLEKPPAGVPKFSGTMPSGCSFWKLAAEGRTFYTVPSDHYNCPVGSYTHNISLPPERAQELNNVLGLMVQIGYIRMEEVPDIPRLPSTPPTIVFAPLGDSPVDPDVVIFAGQPVRIMQLQEAAQRAGVTSQPGFMGRPTCMAIPASIANGVVASTGCIGNRIYTDVGDDNLYIVVRGADLEAIAREANTIADANAKLTEYHRERRNTLTVAG